MSNNITGDAFKNFMSKVPCDAISWFILDCDHKPILSAKEEFQQWSSNHDCTVLRSTINSMELQTVFTGSCFPTDCDSDPFLFQTRIITENFCAEMATATLWENAQTAHNVFVDTPHLIYNYIAQIDNNERD